MYKKIIFAVLTVVLSLNMVACNEDEIRKNGQNAVDAVINPIPAEQRLHNLFCDEDNVLSECG